MGSKNRCCSVHTSLVKHIVHRALGLTKTYLHVTVPTQICNTCNVQQGRAEPYGRLVHSGTFVNTTSRGLTKATAQPFMAVDIIGTTLGDHLNSKTELPIDL